MDELRPIDVGEAGGLPDLVRMKVRRWRLAHRAWVGGGVVCTVLLVVVGVMIAQPEHDRGVEEWHHGAVISIDDPMFDALDQGGGMNRADRRWRAGARLDGDWVQEM